MWETNEDGTEQKIDVVDGFDHLVAFTIVVRAADRSRRRQLREKTTSRAAAQRYRRQQAQQICRDMRAAAGVA